MKKKLAQLIISCAFLLTSIAMIFVYRSLSVNETRTSPSGLWDYSDVKHYRINSERILNFIDQGKTDVFMPLTVTTETSDLLYANPFPWKQNDYLKIVDALHQYAWHETPDNWKIYFLGFYGDCRYDPAGFDIFRITYYKSIGIERYATREIQIYPLTGEAATGEGASFPKPIFGWKTFDPSEFIVTAEDALKLAEEKGGTEARLSVNDDCRISVRFMSNLNNWVVWYSPIERGQTIFKILVNPITGRYEILNPNE